MLNAAFPLFNGLGILFVLLPSGWHWRARNTPTLLYIFWCLATVIPAFINSVIWFNQDTDAAPVWCDITTKLQIGGNIGLAAASLCITRQLEGIAAARQVHYTEQDRRRRRRNDLLLGIALPVLIMILHTVVQGHRYNIRGRAGCTPTVYWSYPAIFLVVIWPTVLFTISAVYAGLAMRLFLLRRRQFAQVLQASQSALSTGRFIRLMALASFQIAFTLPLVVYALALDILGKTLHPYTSWADVHLGFDAVFIATERELDTLPTLVRQLGELLDWDYAVACAIFFVFFGLGDESLTAYRGWYHAVSTRCRRHVASRDPG